jgi:GDP-L-fucose synthase
VTLWGTGTPRREFLYVDDMAAASVHVMNLPKTVYDAHTSPMQSHINVGCGDDITIAQLAQQVAQAVGFTGELVQDTTKPDGAPRKLMNSQRLSQLGWQASTPLQQGLALAYQDFLKQSLQAELTPTP